MNVFSSLLLMVLDGEVDIDIDGGGGG